MDALREGAQSDETALSCPDAIAVPISWLIWVMPPVTAAGKARMSRRLTFGVKRGRRKPMEAPA